MKHSTLARKLTAALLSVALMTQALLTAPQASAADTSAPEAFRTLIRQAWEAHDTNTINLRRFNLTLEEATDIYYETLYTDADWIDVASSFRYSVSNNIITGLVPQYNYSEEIYNTNRMEFEAKVAEVTAELDPRWSDAEKVLYLHDYLAEHCAYDLTFQSTSYNAYSALVAGSSVCQGYALAMIVLCREAGIPCYAVTYRTNTEQGEDNHMWNVVELDGNWYHVDTTFDDSAPDVLGHAMHQYLLQSDAVMLADGVHKTADTWGYFTEGKEIVCDSELYADAFWVNSLDTVQPLADGTWLYAQKADYDSIVSAKDISAALCRSDMTGTTETLGTYSATWRTSGSSYYMDCYISSQYFGEKIYFHTADTIYALSPAGGDIETVYTLTAEQFAKGDLYGFTIDETGLLTYQVMRSLDYGSNYAKDIDFYTLQLDYDTPPDPETTTAASETTTTEVTTTTAQSAASETTTTAATTAAAMQTTTTAAATTSQITTSQTTTSQTTTSQTTTSQTTTSQTTTSQTTTSQTTTSQTTTSQTTTSQTTASQTTASQTTAAPTTAVTTTTAAETTASAASTTESTTTTTTTAAALTMQLCGDVSNDGAVDVSDAVQLARMVLSDPDVIVSEQGLANADCDGSGKLDSSDVIWIVRFIAGLIEA